MVYKPDGSTHIFKQSSRGLYYLNIGKASVALMNMVEDKQSKYKVNAYEFATIARELQRTIGIHVPEIERYVRAIKQRTRAQYATLPLKALPP